MYVDEFIEKYRGFKTEDPVIAQQECDKVNAIAVGFRCMSVQSPDKKGVYILMTAEVYYYLKAMDVM